MTTQTTSIRTAWPIHGLRKDPRTLDVAGAIAEARRTAARTRCGQCGSQGGAYDYEYTREPYSLRHFVLCGNGHLEEF